ncbi:hypothetical protein AVEN_164532-1 [Araneus ventricosus]|uniref:Uncharacterized protein n=1 Tax=Araneus ventricosus TaxID=182803 RepID=A0A4Y2B2D8_ARAVE|nr:hypothetical protein AVEN_164532-1 [Araneus ventricosus]
MGSGQVNVQAILRNRHTLVARMRPECTIRHLIPCAEGRRRVGNIHSGGHSTANPLENRILRPSFSLFIRVMSLGVANKTNMHLTPTIFNITIRKVSSLTKSMMLNNIVIDFYSEYRTVFQIRTITSNFAASCAVSGFLA